MRIAVITTSYPTYEGDPSGHFVHAEVCELEREGHEVRVLHPPPGGAFGWPGAPTRIKERPSRSVGAALWTARAAVELARLRPDRVVAHWCVPSAFPIALAGPPLEVVSHGSDVRLVALLPPSVRASVVRAILRRATRWRFVSAALRDTLEASLEPAERARLRACAEIVPGALEVPDVLDDARAKRQAIHPKRLYVCAGRLVASKRVDKVIDYVATTPDAYGTTRHQRTLVVLGDGPERAHLERVARAWQIDVRFLGKTTRRETLGWIGAADELVHASRMEGLSTVVREAEQLGVAVTLL
jgi:glycosyltransferase involved in cell wall biosynthesis